MNRPAEPGDVAYWHDRRDDQHYYYFYTEPDPKPYWRLWFKDDVVDKYLEEINKLKNKYAITNEYLILNEETKNIEEIQNGDIVISYNVLTNNFYSVKVKKLIVNND